MFQNAKPTFDLAKPCIWLIIQKQQPSRGMFYWFCNHFRLIFLLLYVVMTTTVATTSGSSTTQMMPQAPAEVTPTAPAEGS